MEAINIKNLGNLETTEDNNLGVLWPDGSPGSPSFQLVTLRPTQLSKRPETLEASIPPEQLVQSAPIATLLTDVIKSNKAPNTEKFVVPGKSEVMVNNYYEQPTPRPPSVLNTPTKQLTEDNSKTAEKELINFIQKLMAKANKEQADKDINSRPVFNSAASLLDPSLQNNPFFPIKATFQVQTPAPLPEPASLQIWDAEVITSTVKNLMNKIQSTAMTTPATTNKRKSPSISSTTSTSPSTPSTPSMFSPIPLGAFPKISLTDFISPQSLQEEETDNKVHVTPPPQKSLPVLPFRTTLRAATTTTRTTTSTASTSTSTTTERVPQAILTRLLSEAAAPLAGLSAATLAYSAAAMLPVWLPVALGRRRRETEEEQSQEEQQRVLQSLQYKHSDQ